MALIFALLAAAQQPVPAPANAPATGIVKFQSNTQLVIETVSVKDKNGKPVEGLTAKDFAITEDGVAQTISFCEFQRLDDTQGDFSQLIAGPGPAEPPAAPAAAAPPTAPAVAVPGVTAHQIMPERPGDIRYRDRRLMAMYFDMSAMPVPDQVRAETAALKFIQKQMLPADLMAILSFNGASVQVLQDFTDKKDDLATVINKLFVVEEGLGETTNDDSTADTGAAFGEDDSEFNLFTTDRQLGALQTAVKMLGQLNEKKVLVYFASGLQLNGIDNQAQFQATTNAAKRANVSFYTVDARGLVAQSPLGDATRGSPGGLGMYSGMSAMANANNFQKSQDTL
jgi:VWFA-related protein